MALPDNPLTRGEQYLNRIATGEGTIPDEPLTRIEQYLDYIAENGDSGGGGGGAVASVNGKTGAVVLDAEDVGANSEPLEIPLTESGDEFSTTATAAQIRAAKENSVFVLGEEARIKAVFWLNFDEDLDILVGTQFIDGTFYVVTATVTTNNVAITAEQIVIPTSTSDLTNDAGYITENDVKTAPIDDTGGYFSNDTVEGALQEIGAELSGINTLIGSGVIS